MDPHQPDLLGIPPPGWGVGNDPTPSPQEGGGYLSVCAPFEFLLPAGLKKNSRDPRIDELAAMGLRQTFIDIAEAIGFDNFMTVWKIFDADPAFLDQDPSGLRIRMPLYRAWERYQRNRYMEALFHAGLSVEEVRSRVKKYLRENLTKRHVSRFMKQV